MKNKIEKIKQRIIKGGAITEGEAREFNALCDGGDIQAFADAAGEIMRHFCGNRGDLCSLVNAKSGKCSEDCAFCAQSSHAQAGVKEYELLSVEELVCQAIEAEKMGTHRFCIVTSGKKLNEPDFEKVIEACKSIKEKTRLKLDGSLGFLSSGEIKKLHDAGVTKINHNLETSERFFPEICSTHTFSSRCETIKRLKAQGMKVCAGGIIGLGEMREDRVSMAFSLKELEVDSVPINILNPRAGTRLARAEKLSSQEIIKTISVFRFILPRITIKVAGGREVNLGEDQERALRAGANGIILGEYLTTAGNPVAEDIKLMNAAGFEI